jgi:adenylate kinase
MYRAFLLIGAPGSGKGTQGKIIGSIPGFFHIACGDIFRSLDLRSDLGKLFWDYSSRGQLVPDRIVMEMWQSYLSKMVTLGRFKPEIDHLILDGIPRNLAQAEMLNQQLNVIKVFHLHCPDRNALIDRMRKRAIKENRFDDASEEIILKRLAIYETETKPIIDFYGSDKLVTIDSTQFPYKVLRDILNRVDTSEPL